MCDHLSRHIAPLQMHTDHVPKLLYLRWVLHDVPNLCVVSGGGPQQLLLALLGLKMLVQSADQVLAVGLLLGRGDGRLQAVLLQTKLGSALLVHA